MLALRRASDKPAATPPPWWRTDVSARPGSNCPYASALPAPRDSAPNSAVTIEPLDRCSTQPPSPDGNAADATRRAACAELRVLARELADALEALARMAPCHARPPHSPHLH